MSIKCKDCGAPAIHDSFVHEHWCPIGQAEYAKARARRPFDPAPFDLDARPPPVIGSPQWMRELEAANYAGVVTGRLRTDGKHIEDVKRERVGPQYINYFREDFGFGHVTFAPEPFGDAYWLVIP